MPPRALLALIMPVVSALTGVPSGAAPGKPSIVRRDIFLTAGAQRKVVRYWTPERMRDAVDGASLGPLALFGPHPAPPRPGSSRPGHAPPRRARAPRATARRVRSTHGAVWPDTGAVRETTGKVFFTLDGRDYVCSASTVQSANSDLVVTAGHCAKDGTGSWTQNWIYVPGYDDGTARYGAFTARRMFVTTAWSRRADESADVAMIDVNARNGAHVDQAAGAQGIAFDQPRSAQVFGFGYPAEGGYNGERLAYCSGLTHGDPHRLTRDLGLPCSLTEGSSGGPWLSRFDGAAGTGVLTSVSTFKYANDPDTMYGPYFDATVKHLYDQAQHA